MVADTGTQCLGPGIPNLGRDPPVPELAVDLKSMAVTDMRIFQHSNEPDLELARSRNSLCNSRKQKGGTSISTLRSQHFLDPTRCILP